MLDQGAGQAVSGLPGGDTDGHGGGIAIVGPSVASGRAEVNGEGNALITDLNRFGWQRTRQDDVERSLVDEARANSLSSGYVNDLSGLEMTMAEGDADRFTMLVSGAGAVILVEGAGSISPGIDRECWMG